MRREWIFVALLFLVGCHTATHTVPATTLPDAIQTVKVDGKERSLVFQATVVQVYPDYFGAGIKHVVVETAFSGSKHRYGATAAALGSLIANPGEIVYVYQIRQFVRHLDIYTDKYQPEYAVANYIVSHEDADRLVEQNKAIWLDKL